MERTVQQEGGECQQINRENWFFFLLMPDELKIFIHQSVQEIMIMREFQRNV